MSDQSTKIRTHQALPKGIAIIGADGSGKTYLFDQLAEHFGPNGFQYLRSIAGDVIRRGYPLGKDASKDSYVELNRKYVSLLNEGLRDPNAFLSDRSLIDAYCYALVNFGLPRPQIPEDFIEFLREQWLMELNFVEIYILCNRDFKPEDDGVRVTDSNYLDEITETFGRLLDEAEKSHGTRVLRVRGKGDTRLISAAKFISRETGIKGISSE